MNEADTNDYTLTETEMARLDVILTELECLKIDLLEKRLRCTHLDQGGKNTPSIAPAQLRDELDRAYDKLNQIECQLNFKVPRPVN